MTEESSTCFLYGAASESLKRLLNPFDQFALGFRVSAVGVFLNRATPMIIRMITSEELVGQTLGLVKS